MQKLHLVLLIAFGIFFRLSSAQSSCATPLDLTGKELARKLVPYGPNNEVPPQTFYADFPGSTGTGNSSFVLSILAVLAPQDDLCISATILTHSFSKCFAGLGGINATIATAIQPSDQGRAVFNVWCWECDSPVTFTISATLTSPNAPAPSAAHRIQRPKMQQTRCESNKCGMGEYCMIGCASATAQCGCRRDRAICSC